MRLIVYSAFQVVVIAGDETDGSILQGCRPCFISRCQRSTSLGTDKSHHTGLNSQMRRIDLFCKLIGPLAISLVDGFATKIAILCTCGLSVVSVAVEYFAISQVRQKLEP